MNADTEPKADKGGAVKSAMAIAQSPKGAPTLAALAGRGLLPAELRLAGGLKKLDYLLALPDPSGTIEGLSTEELYLLIDDIGRGDAYALLPLASAEQLNEMVALDTWHKQELQLGRWLELLDLNLAASMEQGLRFLRANDDEVLEWLFMKDVTVHPSDLDLDMVPDDQAAFQTPDMLYWVTLPRGHALEDRMPGLLKQLWAADTDRMRVIFQQAQFDLLASVETYMQKFRGGKLQDMGFPRPEEAAEIFATTPLRPMRQTVLARVEEARKGLAAQDAEEVAPTGPSYVVSQGSVVEDLVLRAVSPPELLSAAAAALDEPAREGFAQGMTYLINAVYLARTDDLSRTDELPAAAEHAAGLVNLGLSWLCQESVELATEILATSWVRELFQVGQSLVRAIGDRARALQRLTGEGTGYRLFGSPVDETLHGLSLPRPLLFEGAMSRGKLNYRTFRSMDELSRVELMVEDAEAVLGFFSERLGFSVAALDGALRDVDDGLRSEVQFATLFRTGLAHSLLTDAFDFSPLDRDDITAFARAAFTKQGRLSDGMQAAVDALSDTVSEPVSRWMTDAMEVLRQAIGPVAPKDIDTRFTGQLFLVTQTDA